MDESMREYLRRIGAKGGRARTEAKREAARANGNLAAFNRRRREAVAPPFASPSWATAPKPSARCAACGGRRTIQDPVSQEYAPCPECASGAAWLE